MSKGAGPVTPRSLPSVDRERWVHGALLLLWLMVPVGRERMDPTSLEKDRVSAFQIPHVCCPGSWLLIQSSYFAVSTPREQERRCLRQEAANAQAIWQLGARGTKCFYCLHSTEWNGQALG